MRGPTNSCPSGAPKEVADGGPKKKATKKTAAKKKTTTKKAVKKPAKTTKRVVKAGSRSK